MKKAVSLLVSLSLVLVMLCNVVLFVSAEKDYAKIDLSGYVAGMTSASNFAQSVVTSNRSYENWGLGIASLIDGSVGDPRYVGAAEAQIADPFAETWIQIDLQKTYTVNKLAFYSFMNVAPNGLPKAFTIEVSEDGTTFKTLYTETDLAVTTVPDSNAYAFTFAETKARYVKLNITAIKANCDLGESVCLREIEVYGEEAAGITDYPKIDLSGYVAGMTSASNFAQSVVTSNRSYENWGLGIASLIDGSVGDPRYVGAAEAQIADPFAETWIQIDLQKTYTVNKLAFYSFMNVAPNGLPKAFTIEVSEDGTTFKTLYTETDLAVTTVPDSNAYAFTFAETKARYVKLNITAIKANCDLGESVCLREIEVYGKEEQTPPTPPTPPNPGVSNYNKLSLSASALSASHSLELWGYGLANLVDGNTPVAGGLPCTWLGCTSPDNATLADVDTTDTMHKWIQIDLGKTCKVDMLRWHEWNAGTLGAAPISFSIYVSNSTDDWGEAVCTEADIAARADGWYAFSFDEKEGRYVRFVITKTGGIGDSTLLYTPQLSELEVYGAPTEPTPAGKKIDLADKTLTLSEKLSGDAIGNLFDNDFETKVSLIADDRIPGRRMDFQWVMLDLKEQKTVNAIRLAARADNNLGGFPTDFDIQVSTDGKDFTTVKTVNSVSLADKEEETYYRFTFAPVAARYVRIGVRDIGGVGEQSLGYVLVLKEFEVYDESGKIDLTPYVRDIETWMAAQGINYAWASNYVQDVVTASQSYEQWGWGVAGLIDGKISEYAPFAAAPNNLTEPITGVNGSVTIDLKGGYVLDAFRFASFKKDSLAGLPQDFTLEVSLDGVFWQKVLDRKDLTLADSFDGRQYHFALSPTTPVRFVRLNATKLCEPSSADLGWCVTLSEIAVYGTLDSTVAIKPDGYGKIDLSRAILRASNSYNLWGHGAGNLYNGSATSSLFIATSVDDADYYARFKDTETFENKTNEYLKIRFDGVYKIDTMRFQSWWHGAGEGVPQKFSVEASLDGETWTMVYTNTDTTLSEDDWYQFALPEFEAKYLRLRFFSVVAPCDLGYCAALKELEFYGVKTAQDDISYEVEDPDPILPLTPGKSDDGAQNTNGNNGNADDGEKSPTTGYGNGFIVAPLIALAISGLAICLCARRKREEYEK